MAFWFEIKPSTSMVRLPPLKWFYLGTRPAAAVKVQASRLFTGGGPSG